MRAKWIFALLVVWVVLIALTVVLAPQIISSCTPKQLRIYAAIGGIGALVLLRLLYLNLLRPINAVTAGMELVRAQDFGSRLVKVGQIDADKLVGMFNKMIETLKGERLKNIEQNNFLQLLIKASPTGIAILDFDEKITMANPTMLSMLGTDEATALGKKPEELDGELAEAIGAIEQGQVGTVRLSDTNIVRISRLSFMEMGFTRPFVIVEVLTDDLRKAEKNAYGKVIRLIAHEVNNTIAGVNSMLETTAMIMEQERDIADAIDSCRERCKSMSEFITSYADVVRIPTARLSSLGLRKRIERMMPFLEGLAGETADIKMHFPDNEVYADADAVLLEQVMVNIVKNSVESIADRGGKGTIDISVGANPPRIEVVDNGAGITPEASKSLFSPFFSTKRDGQGLGLMMVGEILRQHGCRFSLRTDPSDGLTRFKIEFPE
ncbi:MAG: PAS domain-containing protein [Paramuribaculum sp.]|nr:PAS domain-containing protein [Paramuribaculum sp.]